MYFFWIGILQRALVKELSVLQATNVAAVLEILVSRGCLAFLCVRAVCTSLNSVPFWIRSEWPARVCFVVSVTGTCWRWAC